MNMHPTSPHPHLSDRRSPPLVFSPETTRRSWLRPFFPRRLMMMIQTMLMMNMTAARGGGSSCRHLFPVAVVSPVRRLVSPFSVAVVSPVDVVSVGVGVFR
ncbi:hypothetical protein Hanom_Chr03g00188001 [Helianthus anomalus]